MRRLKPTLRVAWSARLLLISLSAALLMFSIFHAWSTQRRFVALRTDSDAIKDLLGALTEHLSLLKDAETAIRGMILSQQPEFLQPLADAESGLPAEIARLRRAEQRTGADAEAIERLIGAGQEHLALSLRLADLAKADPLLARDEIRAEKSLMDEVRRRTSILAQWAAAAVGRLENEKNSALARLSRTIIIAILTATVFNAAVAASFAIELRQRGLAATQSARDRERLHLAMSGAQLGSWHWDLRTDAVEWSDRAKQIFGMPISADALTLHLFLDRLHPDDRERVARAVQRSLDTGESFDAEYRYVWPDGSLHWIAALGQVYYEPSGRPSRMEGIAQDIDAQKERERRVRELNESLEQRVAARTAELANANAEVRRSRDLMQMLHQAQTHFILDADARVVFSPVLRSLMEWTRSQCAFLYAAQHDDGNALSMIPLSVVYDFTSPESNQSLPLSIADPYYAPYLMQLHREAAEAGHAIFYNSNPLLTHQSPTGSPLPALCSFAAIPLFAQGRAMGAIGLGSCPDGYSESLLEPLDPILSTVPNLLLARENHARRQKAEGALRRESEERRRVADELRLANEGLEDRVRQRTASLEDANKELETFSYSVSHDLRAPLRHIGGYAELLEKEAGGSLSPKGHRYMAIIRQSVFRMESLINELLDFSRIGRAEIKRARVDTGAMVRAISDACLAEADGRDLSFVIGDMPTIEADPTLIQLVFQNLISNAVKYTGKNSKAIVQIGHRRESGSASVFWVKDNGAGFDMRYVDKLFGVFQRLHNSADFEGNGIGLATVRRIVARHGGKAWAKGEVGAGAEFYFSIPG